VNYAGIPGELQSIPQWVLWKPGKRPVQPDGSPAKVNDPLTWYNWPQVIEAYLDGGFEGVGFVLTSSLGITVIDWDDCTDGDKPRPALVPYLDQLDSFTERSPGGGGLHVWMFGNKPGNRSKVGNPADGIKAAEIYDDARFLTVTGHALEQYPAGLQSRQDELDAIYRELFPDRGHDRPRPANTSGHGLDDGALLAKIRSSKQADAFAALFERGDTSSHGGDSSSADMALCNMLAFWTARDAQQMDRLFRKGELMRPKWDEMRGAKTYGQITIAEAIAGTTEVYSTRVEYTPEQLREMIDASEDEFELMGEIANAVTDSKLAAGVTHALRKLIAKKSGTTIKALEADARAHDPAPDGPSQLDHAREAKSSYGDGNLIHAQGGFFAWRHSGVWRGLDDQAVKQRIHRVVSDDDITGNTVDSILKLVRTESFVDDVAFGAPFDGINCLNGELHFFGGQWRLQPHQRQRYLLSQVPVEYDSSADAPRFRQFLAEVFEGDPDRVEKQWLVLELMGYTLLTSCRYEKFAILIGSGANGKSVLLELIKALCGTENVAAVAPDKLDNSFQRAYLHGKYANLVTEIAEGAVINDAALKAITSGELTTAEHKFRPPFSFSPYATCWFGTNHMPRTRDFSDALFRRACVITFNNKFEGSRRDPLLKEKLLAELPGVLRLALDGLARVIARGHFTEPGSMLEAGLEWRQEADQVSQFIDDCCHVGAGETPKKTVYDNYKAWTLDNGITRTLSQRSFTNRVRQIRGVGEKKSGSVRSYTGLTVVHSTIKLAPGF
jgi:P4 family phage/plasmid primase-like protien